MSRQVQYGAFTTEGAGATPWTDEDALRLAGRYVRPGDREPLHPHVMTRLGPVWIGAVRPLSPGRRCLFCGAHKVSWNRAGDDFCFSCGRHP